MSRRFQSTYANDELELEVGTVYYKIDVYAVADEYHDPGCMYLRNGDPGDPPEDSFELNSVDAVWYDEDGNDVTPTKEMTDTLWEYLRKHKEQFEED